MYAVKTYKIIATSFLLMTVLTGMTVARANDSNTTTSVERKAARTANSQLQRAVRTELIKRKLDVAGVRIVARDGSVTLVGTVRDERQIALAGDSAEAVPGVQSLKNNLTLRVEGH
jgi:hyperosmotically inducible protein